MKRFALFLTLAIVCLTACNDQQFTYESPEDQVAGQYELTAEEAKEILFNFINDGVQTRSISPVITTAKKHSYVIDELITRSAVIEEGEIPVYEFKIRDNGVEGYGLVIGDKRISKVLVSVEDGALADTAFIVPLQMYVRSIPDLLKNELDSYYTADISKGIMSASMTTQEYTCKVPTDWGQWEPYNSWCPVANCDKSWKAPTGCVATAIAQICAYYKYPVHLDWSAMLRSRVITNSSPEIARTHVGRLMIDIGNKVEMNYACSGSGVASYKIQSLVPAVFSSYNLSPGVFYGRFDLNEIKYSLMQKRPVFLCGVCDAGGHAWVVDAYRGYVYSSSETDNYLNMNWGWDGRSNGFYYVEANPVFYAEGYWFNRGFQMVSRAGKNM